MTYVPENPTTVNDDVAPRQRTEDRDVAELLQEVVGLLRLLILHQEIITDTELDDSDIDEGPTP